MHFRFIGSGDAFGSGGRLNTCFQVVGEKVNFLIDIGASSLIGMKAQAVDRNAIQTIFVTHFHADHFGGLPFFMLDAQFFSRRVLPLTVVGPAGLPKWYERVMETAFPGSFATKPKFRFDLIEVVPGQTLTVGDVAVTAFQAVHGNPGGPFLAYRFEAESKVLAYTGDTEWTDALVDAGYEADLMIAEAYFFDKKVKLHLDVDSLEKGLGRMRPKRLVLTHMSDDMLERAASLPYETASDGLVLELKDA
ncbi:MAG: MBL fold metallo-hydrolase [Ideonella sp.]|nr:MBL fold metallo-hydrolase [Ideonella sp.]